jgi:hypothetical protein
VVAERTLSPADGHHPSQPHQRQRYRFVCRSVEEKELVFPCISQLKRMASEDPGGRKKRDIQLLCTNKGKDIQPPPGGNPNPARGEQKVPPRPDEPQKKRKWSDIQRERKLVTQKKQGTQHPDTASVIGMAPEVSSEKKKKRKGRRTRKRSERQSRVGAAKKQQRHRRMIRTR